MVVNENSSAADGKHQRQSVKQPGDKMKAVKLVAAAVIAAVGILIALDFWPIRAKPRPTTQWPQPDR